MSKKSFRPKSILWKFITADSEKKDVDTSEITSNSESGSDSVVAVARSPWMTVSLPDLGKILKIR